MFSGIRRINDMKTAANNSARLVSYFCNGNLEEVVVLLDGMKWTFSALGVETPTFEAYTHNANEPPRFVGYANRAEVEAYVD